MTARIFILSPAKCGGRRAQILLNPEARFDIARQVASRRGAPLGEVFSFLSGLYFRGKLAYAQAFSQDDDGAAPLVITPDRGLVPVSRRVRHADLLEFSEVPIDLDEPRYRRPLTRDVRRLAATLPTDAQAVLLGSIATGKYCDVLVEHFGERAVFPRDFVGRGDMSRGGLMLRAVDSGEELKYVPIVGAVRRGARPAKLPRRI